MVDLTDFPTARDVKKARKSAGLSQAEAAELIKKTPKAWSHWEQGIRRMPWDSHALFLLLTGQKKVQDFIKNKLT